MKSKLLRPLAQEIPDWDCLRLEGSLVVFYNRFTGENKFVCHPASKKLVKIRCPLPHNIHPPKTSEEVI